LSPGVHRTANVVPDGRFDLPLVEESGGWAIEYEGGGDTHRAAGVVVHIQEHLAACGLTGGRRLSAGLGALDDYSPGRLQPPAKFRVNDAGTIRA
jgi:hypothetical protein